MHTAIFATMLYNIILNVLLTRAFWQPENLVNIHGEETIRLFEDDEINDLENYEDIL